MPPEHPHNGCWLPPPHLPQPNTSIEAPTGKQAPIGTPGHRVHRAAMAGERLQVRAPLGVPEANSGIISAAGKRVSIGSKGDALDVVGMPVRPEQGTALQVPQLDGPIPAPCGERISI